MRYRHVGIFFAISLLMLQAAFAADRERETFGWVEMARVEPVDAQVKAKLDSGALTSSMHAENVETFEKDGEKWVRFELELYDEHRGKTISEEIEKPLHRDLVVRGAGGEEHRPVVLMQLCLGNRVYEEQFSLEDRDDMNYPILLGRRTIQNLGAIDVTRTFLHEPACNEKSPVHAYEDKIYDEDIGV